MTTHLLFYIKVFIIFNIVFCYNVNAEDSQKSRQFNVNFIRALVGKEFTNPDQADYTLSYYEEEDNNDSKNSDPLEKYNRVMFKFNMGLDEYIVEPVSNIYKYVPEDVRFVLTNLYKNINYTPFFATYSVLQLDIESLMITAWRFGLNFTLGVFGLFDIAGMFGLEAVEKDLDQTLSCYGMPYGPYFVLPILGANTLTNALELPVYWILSLYDPYLAIFGFGNQYSLPFAFLGPTQANAIISRYFGTLYAHRVFNARITADALIQDIKTTSIDGYLTLRDFYLKNHDYSINKENYLMTNGRLIKEKPIFLSNQSRINEEQLREQWQNQNDDQVEYNF